MFRYVMRSRCGLVLNRNLPIDEVHRTDEALHRFFLAQWNAHLKDDIDFHDEGRNFVHSSW